LAGVRAEREPSCCSSECSKVKNMASPARNECGEGKDRRSSSLTSPTCRVSSYCATGICFDVVESQSRLRLMCCLETVVEMRSAGEVVMRRVRRDEQTTLGRMKIRRDVCDEEFLERAWVVSLARKWSRQRCRVTSRADVSETFPVRQYGELRRALKRCVVLYRRSGTNTDDHVDCGCVWMFGCVLLLIFCAMRRASVESRMIAQKSGTARQRRQG